MSNEVTFYKITDDYREINKDITGTKYLGKLSTVKVKGTSGILTPTLVLKYDATYAGANYCYIDAPFNRYYFLSPPELAPGGRMVFSGSVDPLMSFKDEINALNVIIRRKTGSNVKEIADGKAQTLTRPSILTIESTGGTEFVGMAAQDDDTLYHYILTVVGGADNSSP